MSLITLPELNPHKYPTTPEIDENLNDLLVKINKANTAAGWSWIVTSALRDTVQQQRLLDSGQSKATKSNHLTGKAVDIYDPTGKINKWALENQDILEAIGLWCENRQGDWQHFQTCEPHSGHRFFNP